MDQNKVIHALLYAITAYPHIGKTQLMKYILFCDLFSYNTKQTTILEDHYKKMQNGPVPQYAFSFAGESNQFFLVRKSRQQYDITGYNAIIKPDMTIFSQYEKSLLNFVLRTVSKKSAKLVSRISHMRLWENAEELSKIELEDFILNSNEIMQLQEYGFYFPEYQRDFCYSILEKAAWISKLIHPISRDKIDIVEDFLDERLKLFPKTELRVFYDAYLAWDDTYRSALKVEPQTIPEISNEFCDAFSTIIMETHVDKQTINPVELCENYEQRLDGIHDRLIGKRVLSKSESASSPSILKDIMPESRSNLFGPTP